MMRIIQELHAIIHWCDEQLAKPDLTTERKKELEQKRDMADQELTKHLII